MNLYQYHELDPSPVQAQFDKVTGFLRKADFRAADAKKLVGTPYYRAKLNDTDRLLFRFARYNGQTCLLLLELIFHHAYEKSRFLRGAVPDESKMPPLPTGASPNSDDIQLLPYVPGESVHFHLLDKILFFDADQRSVLELPVPLIVIGSAGSGKTALTLEKARRSTCANQPAWPTNWAPCTNNSEPKACCCAWANGCSRSVRTRSSTWPGDELPAGRPENAVVAQMGNEHLSRLRGGGRHRRLAEPVSRFDRARLPQGP